MNTKPKRKRCKQCGALYEPKSSLQVACSPKCAIEYTKDKEQRKSVIKTASESDRREVKQKIAKVKANDISWQHSQTQRVFNRMRVLQEKLWFKERGLEPECISCGKTKMDWCCGHFKTRGSQRELAYDPLNTYLQCNRYCNSALSGNINGNKTTRGYIQGLKDRFGEEEAKRILDYLEQKTVKKWTCEELDQMRKEFNEEIRRLEGLVND